MTLISYSQLIFHLSLIIYCTSESNINRYRRQVVDGANRNIGVPQQKPAGSIPLNNVPLNNIPLNNAPLNPPNNPNIIIPNVRNNQQQQQQQQQQQPINNNHLLAASQPQMQPARSGGFYNSPGFQPPPFTGEKPSGWFGTNHINWVSNQQSELDKNKVAAAKTAVPNNPQVSITQPRREDSGSFFLHKVARQYASQGDKAFTFGPYETLEGRGSVCTNHENFDGYQFGTFPCPLPAGTGMNPNAQFCCGPTNYQYCCTIQEFSQTQRGAFSDNRYIGDQSFPKQAAYPPTTRKILAVIIPVASFIVLTGIVALVFLYYKKFRNDQSRSRRLPGSIRLEDTYSIVPQELPAEKTDITLT